MEVEIFYLEEVIGQRIIFTFQKTNKKGGEMFLCDERKGVKQKFQSNEIQRNWKKKE